MGHSGRRAARWASSKSSSKSTSRSVSEHSNDDLPVPQVMEELLKKFELSPGAHLGAHTDRRYACAADFGDISPGAHLGAHTDHRARSLSRGNCKGDQALSSALPAERISERSVDQIVDWPVPQIEEQIAEVAKTTPQERFSKRTVVQAEDVPVPQILKEVVKAVKTVPQERISETICEKIVDAPVPQTVDEPVPSFQEEFDKMIELFPEERVPKRIIQGFTPQERVSERANEQIVDQPGDQARRVPADFIHRQGCRSSCGDGTTGPSVSDSAEDREHPAGAVHRQRVGDQACRDSADSLHRQGGRGARGDAATGPSVSRLCRRRWTSHRCSSSAHRACR